MKKIFFIIYLTINWMLVKFNFYLQFRPNDPEDIVEFFKETQKSMKDHRVKMDEMRKKYNEFTAIRKHYGIN